jgi:ABC-type transport system involved in multi-copper enzyme maturation permease subunit
MKRLFISLTCGIAILITWVALIIFTSQDFVHEGPNGLYAAPLYWWASILSDSVFHSHLWHRVASRLPKLAEEIIMLSGLFVPFILFFSSISYVILRYFSLHSSKHRNA